MIGIPMIAGSHGNDDAVVRACANLWPTNTPCAVQITMPPGARFRGPFNKARACLNRARDRAKQLLALHTNLVPRWFVLNYEAPARTVAERVKDYRQVATLARKRGWEVMGGYGVPRVDQQGRIMDQDGETRMWGAIGGSWICPSTYSKRIGEWRSVAYAAGIASSYGAHLVPYVSAQYWGTQGMVRGTTLGTNAMRELRTQLEAVGVERVICWVGTGWGSESVESMRQMREVFG